MKQSGFGHYDSFGHPFKTKTACCDVNKLLSGVACSIRLFFLSVNTGRPHMTSSWIYRKGSVSEEIRKPLVYTITGELQNSYSLWFSEVAVAVVTCCLRWYFHAIGKENRKAACDVILYKVKGKSLTNSIRGYPEVVSCHWDRKMKKLLFSLVFIAFIFYVSSWSYVRKPTACFRS